MPRFFSNNPSLQLPVLTLLIMSLLGGCASFDRSIQEADRLDKKETQLSSLASEPNGSELQLDLGEIPEDALVPRPLKNHSANLPNVDVAPIDVSESGVFNAVKDLLRGAGLSLAIKGDPSGSRNYGSNMLFGVSGTLTEVMDELADTAGFFYYRRGKTVVVEFEQKFVVSLPPIVGEDSLAGLVNTVQHLGAKDTYLDRSNRTLVFSANRRTFNLVAEFMESTRQTRSIIAYDMQIYQVDLNDSSNKGIRWNKLGFNSVPGVAANAVVGGTTNIIGGSVSGTTTGTTNTLAQSSTGNAVVDTAASVVSAAALATKTASGMGLVLAGSRFSSDLLIDFLETQGNVRTLSRPQINIINGAKASIRVGGRTSYVAKVGTNFSTSLNQSTMETAVLPTGIEVSLVGNIADGTVYTTVNLSVADVVRFEEVSVLGLKASLPQTVDRELQTIVRSRPGDTVLLGGMTVDRIADETNSGLGANGRTKSNTRSELVIALTPRILRFAKPTQAAPLPVKSSESLNVSNNFKAER